MNKMTLKKLLKTSKNARTVFGKKEIEIILKQLQGINLTQSERNRLSANIKKKLEFIKEAAQFSDEFELKKNQDNKKKIDTAVQKILHDQLKDNIKAILLFGSFADNTFTKRSDIDICVIFKKNISEKEATKFRIRTSAQVADKIDIQVFNILPQKVKREIAKNHKQLYTSEEHDNIGFTIKNIKNNDFFIRSKNILGTT